MKKVFYLLPLVVFVTIGAVLSFTTEGQTIVQQIKPNKVIYIQPLGDVKQEYLELVEKTVESFYGFECIVNPKAPLTNNLLAESKTRYSANKILRQYRGKDNYLILTEKDIATPSRGYPEWGVLGLGYRPGSVCVVSTFRMKRNVSVDVIKDRIKKVSIHEVGHNLGLDHCTNHPECLMNDANGTIKQVDREKMWLCDRCKQIIGM